jgi:hypothetical protein
MLLNSANHLQFVAEQNGESHNVFMKHYPFSRTWWEDEIAANFSVLHSLARASDLLSHLSVRISCL